MLPPDGSSTPAFIPLQAKLLQKLGAGFNHVKYPAQEPYCLSLTPDNPHRGYSRVVNLRPLLF